MMFALGLFASLTAAIAPADAVDNRALYPKQFTMSPKGVNMQTGRFMHSTTDLSIGDLTVTRQWGDQPALYTNGKMFGLNSTASGLRTGWSHTLNQGTVPKSSGNETRIQVIVEGQLYEFTTLSGGALVPVGRPSSGANLRPDSGGTNYLFTDKSGGQHSFFVHPAVSIPGYGARTQLLAQTVKPDGTVLSYSYRTTGQLQEVRSSRGYAIHFDYDAANNISKACGYNLAQTYVTPATPCQSGALSASYAYDGDQNLSAATDPTGGVVQMSYHLLSGGAYLVSSISLANSAVKAVTNVYAAQDPTGCITSHGDQVRRQTSATGNVWTYCFTQDEDPSDVPYVPGRPRWTTARMEDPATGGHYLTYDRGRLVDQDSLDGLVNYKYPNTVIEGTLGTNPITFEFSDTLPEMITLPRGDWIYMIYDARGNVVIRSRWPLGSPDPVLADSGGAALSSDPDLRRCCITPGILQEPPGASSVGTAYLPSYPASGFHKTGCGSGEPDARLCDKPIARIDERGAQTDYVYAQAHGGLLKETGPAVDGVRPETRYTYVQRYAWLRTSAGGYAQAATPVWLLASKSLCKAGAANASGTGCATAGDEVVTTYDYGPDSGPNNLLLRGQVEDAGGLSLRTCYRYDRQGNRISETKPRAGLGSCP